MGSCISPLEPPSMEYLDGPSNVAGGTVGLKAGHRNGEELGVESGMSQVSQDPHVPRELKGRRIH